MGTAWPPWECLEHVFRRHAMGKGRCSPSRDAWPSSAVWKSTRPQWLVKCPYKHHYNPPHQPSSHSPFAHPIFLQIHPHYNALPHPIILPVASYKATLTLQLLSISSGKQWLEELAFWDTIRYTLTLCATTISLQHFPHPICTESSSIAQCPSSPSPPIEISPPSDSLRGLNR